MLTTGSSGTRCTRTGRKCLYNATCLNRQCQCPDGQTGNAEFECVDSGRSLCTLSGDPHLQGFGGAEGSVPLPCRYRITRYLTTNLDSVGALGSCSVEVYATNQMSEGRFVIRSVHVTVSVNDPANQALTIADIFKTVNYEVNDSQIYDYKAQTTHRDTIWGSSQGNVQGVNIYPSWDEVNNFAMLDIPQCQTRIKYRAFNPHHPLHSSQLPGLSVMAPSNATFVQDYGTYPSAICGSPGDDANLFHDRAVELNLNHANTAILYDVLSDAPLQTNNSKSAECEAAIQIFNSSTSKVVDINACSFLVREFRVSKCIEEAGMEPVVAFTGCMAHRQGVNTSCSTYLSAAKSCDTLSEWESPAQGDITCP